MTTAQIIDLHRIRLPDGTPVSRALPSRRQRLVGAWCFLDHLKAPAGTGMQVEAHPHIGLQTFTWLLDGEIRHRDSTGSDQIVLPQQVGIMTAGRGISHTEHGSADKPLHAAQLWIALPEHARHRAPEFHHHPQLPQSATPNLRLTLLVGSLNGLQSPVVVHSPLVAADLRCTADGEVRLPLNPAFEYALVVLDGSVETAAGAIDENHFCALASGGSELVFRARAGSRLLLIGGEPFGEDVLMWWNFVGRSHQEIADARADWENAAPRFGEVAGCRERIAAPELSGRVKAQTHP